MYPMVCVCTMCDKQFILSVEEEPKHGVVPMMCDECDAWLERETEAREAEAENANERMHDPYYALLSVGEHHPECACTKCQIGTYDDVFNPAF